jgi:hypothetical protein
MHGSYTFLIAYGQWCLISFQGLSHYQNCSYSRGGEKGCCVGITTQIVPFAWTFHANALTRILSSQIVLFATMTTQINHLPRAPTQVSAMQIIFILGRHGSHRFTQMTSTLIFNLPGPTAPDRWYKLSTQISYYFWLASRK